MLIGHSPIVNDFYQAYCSQLWILLATEYPWLNNKVDKKIKVG
jgi:hypothetical protein